MTAGLAFLAGATACGVAFGLAVRHFMRVDHALDPDLGGRPVTVTQTAQRRGEWMQTFTGRAFYPLDPCADEIDIRDIAHALSLLCRYGGHTRRFYSVAEHCVLMSRAVEPEHALWALLHDATEAYMGDMIRPLKAMMPDYVEAEDRLMATICFRFGLDYGCPPEVKDADNRILVNERQALMGAPPQSWDAVEDLEPLPVRIRGYSAELAERVYLARFTALTGQAA